jgi:hypothetical protein
MTSHSVNTSDIAADYGDYCTTSVVMPEASTATLAKMMASVKDYFADHDDHRILFYPGAWDAFLEMIRKSGIAFSSPDLSSELQLGGDVFGLRCVKTYGGVLVGSRQAFQRHFADATEFKPLTFYAD